MSLLRYPAFLLCLLGLFCQLSATQAQSPITTSEELAASEQKRYLLRRQGERGFAEASNIDVKYYKTYWEIDPAVRYISGEVLIHLQRLDAEPQISLDLSDSLQVHYVYFNGEPAGFSHGDNKLRINLPNTTATVLDSVLVAYSGIPPSGAGFGAFIQSEHNGAPILWTLSEPYGSSEWWPCKMSNDDKADSCDTYIRVPNGYRAAGNGLLVESLVGSVHTIHHWKHRYPIAHYLIHTAVSNYEEFSDTVHVGSEQFPILNYVYPEELAKFEEDAKVTLSCFDVYHELLTPYPFRKEKYGHVRFGWGGGMEHQTMSSMVNLSFDLVAHELAHQWFGNSITCGSWQDIWLNEGFATYMTGLCFEHLAQQYWLLWKRQRINSITSQAGGSVFVPDTTNVGRVFDGRLSYNKGGMVLHMLRWKIGDSLFYAGLRAYLEDSDLKFKTARTPDFIQIMQTVSGQDLAAFFQKWIYQEGYPSYHIKWKHDDTGLLTLQIDQTTSHPSVDFFDMPVPVWVFHGQDTLKLRLDHQFSGQTFSIPYGFTPDSIQFDPELWIISAQNTITQDGSTAVTEYGPLSALQLYPNPASRQVTLSGLPQGKSRIQLYDAAGKLLLEQKAEGNTAILQINDYTPGVYRVLVKQGSAKRSLALRIQ